MEPPPTRRQFLGVAGVDLALPGVSSHAREPRKRPKPAGSEPHRQREGVAGHAGPLTDAPRHFIPIAATS